MDYMKRKTREYEQLKGQWSQRASPEDLEFIRGNVLKDVLRTDRTHPYYAGSEDSPHLTALTDLLTTYAITHPQVSYCQGMSDLASPILAVMDNEAHAFICFCGLMKRLEGNFRPDGSLMSLKFQHLKLLLRHSDPEFYAYLVSRGADDLFFCYRWLLLELKREFAFEDALRMLEVTWSSLPPDPPETEVELLGPALEEGEREREESGEERRERHMPPPPLTPAPLDFDTYLNLSSVQETLFHLSTSHQRTRRAVSCPVSPTLQEILDLGGANVHWSPDQLSCMSNKTFVDGLSTLAAVNGFADQQLAALKGQAVQEHGLDFRRLLDASGYKEKFREDMIRWGEEKRNADPGYFCRLIVRDVPQPVWVHERVGLISELPLLHLYITEPGERREAERRGAERRGTERRGAERRGGRDERNREERRQRGEEQRGEGAERRGTERRGGRDERRQRGRRQRGEEQRGEEQRGEGQRGEEAEMRGTERRGGREERSREGRGQRGEGQRGEEQRGEEAERRKR
ncbi:UNVERIFIED_CONTAM: hypothetical protein FKN15_018170 [Acipenser sinensis]